MTNLFNLLPLIKQLPSYQNILQQMSSNGSSVNVTGLHAARAALVASIYHDTARPVLLISSKPEEAKRIYEELKIWCSPSANLYLYPEFDFSPFEYYVNSDTVIKTDRLRTLTAAALHLNASKREPLPFQNHNSQETHEVFSNQWEEASKDDMDHYQLPPLIVSSALSIMTRTVPQKDFSLSCHLLKTGMSVDPYELMSRWQKMGYERVEFVESPSEMSKRGGIIDIFPVFMKSPIRIEFMGNQIDTIREFNPLDQCSTNILLSAMIGPAKELLLSGPMLSLDNTGLLPSIYGQISEDMAMLQEGQWFPNVEFYSPLCNTDTIFSYLPHNALIITEEPLEIKNSIERLNKEAFDARESKIEERVLPANFPSPYLSWEQIEGEFRSKSLLEIEDWFEEETTSTILPFMSAPRYGGKLSLFLDNAQNIIRNRQRLVVVSQQTKRLAELLQESEIYSSPMDALQTVPDPASITLLKGSLDRGFNISGELLLLTDAELFGFVKQLRLQRGQRGRQQWSIPQLKQGDYVVHVDHGIARFGGLTRRRSEGREQEYMILEYADEGRLYVPTDQIERVNRYIGSSGHKPVLNKLGSQEWHRTKRRVKESVIDIARELLLLYAARELAPGFAFSSDVLWQYELEASFPYAETTDQIDAITSVKEDMENRKPMDRLICGDVGYGKTEVALRAAFKAVMDNKQVAILVPTTVLAQQHFNTFLQRLQTFPLKVEMLSRFCSTEKANEVIEGLLSGTVDICIGTHRLLQKGIMFKDLGLVIIDEEQRFGVVQKERLKQLRQEVDVLTLSATPIPRTLHMSLSGIKDISIMETAPEERLAIKTHVGAFSNNLVRQAVLRELERNGQVFYVHNRVQDISLVANSIQELIPEAEVSIAHGQMPEGKLEKVISDFAAGKSDILVATTIIQLGLDMPNTNTLIVDRADKFGLTQLYQLRGRIGRGTNQAYAYFLYNDGAELSHQARQRLRTIFESSELGSGFAIAMKDLEIRGAGNLLGVKQSGHIAAIGFNLYSQMLAETVKELREGVDPSLMPDIAESATIPKINVVVPIEAYIPNEYIESLNARLIFYSKLANSRNQTSVDAIAREMQDRFGPLPEQILNLLYIMKIRLLALQSGVESIYTRDSTIIIKPFNGNHISANKYHPSAIKIGRTQLTINIRIAGKKWQTILEQILLDTSNSINN